MSRKIRFERQGQGKDGLVHFVFSIDDEAGKEPGREITVGVHGRWFDEEVLKMDKLDLPRPKAMATMLRYIAGEALRQYDKTSPGEDTGFIEIPPDRWVDFDEIRNMAEGSFPDLDLPDSLFPR